MTIVPDVAARPSLRPRLGAVSFLHRFGSALNRHVHLHACVTDGLFRSRHEGQGAEFLPAKG
ncbi:MAG: transposase [Planctomycetota bacterium]